MRLPCRLLYLATHLFLLGCLLLQIRVDLINTAVPYLLPKTLFSETELVLESIDDGHATFASLSTVIALPQGGLHIDCRNISAGYRIKDLRKGMITTLIAETLTITLPPGDPSQPPSPFTVEKLSNLQAYLSRITLPFGRLEIHRLFLRNGPSALLEERPSSLSIDSVNREISLDALLPFSRQEYIALALERDGNGVLKGSVEPWDVEEKKESRIDVRVFGNQVQVTGYLLWDDMRRLVPPEMGTAENVRFKAEVAMEPALPIKADLHAQGARHGRLSAGELSVALTGGLQATENIGVDFFAGLSAGELRAGDLHVGSVAVELDGSYRFEEGRSKVKLTARAPLRMERVVKGRITVDSVTLEQPAELHSMENGPAIVVSEETALQLDGFQLPALSIPRLRISPLSTTPMEVRTHNGRISITGPDWELAPLKVRAETFTLDCDPVTLRLKKALLPGPDIRLSADVPAAELTMKKMSIPLQGITTDFRLNQDRVRGDITFRPQNVPGTVKATVHHDGATGKGKVSAVTTQPLEFGGGSTPSSLIRGITLPLDLEAGSLRLSTETAWDVKKPLRAKVSIRLEKGAGMFREFPFTGLEIDTTLQPAPILRSNKPGRISLARLDTPVPLTNITISPTLNKAPGGRLPLVGIRDLSAEVFSGRIFAPPFSLDLNHTSHHIPLKAEQLALPRIVELLKVKGLAVEGRIDGRIPLSLQPGAVRVGGGEFFDTGQGGIIRYRPPKTGASSRSPFTAYAMKALEEFHFTALRAPVTYEPDGTLIIDLQLQGKSPRLDTDRPVHLNIHTEQNLLSLLKSLQYSKVISDELDEQLQQRP